MMASPVEVLLAQAADAVQEGLESNVETRAVVEVLLAQNQTPHVLRVLQEPRGCECLVVIRKSNA